MSATMADYDGALTTLGFLYMDGAINPSGPVGRDISQPGVAGIARLREGYMGQPFSVRTMAAFSSAVDLGTAMVLYTNYRERNVTIIDDQGNTWYNIFVIGVRIVEHRRISGGVGLLSGYTRLLFAEWELQSAAVSY